MSWSRSKRGRGSEVAAWTAGAFAEERSYPHHSEETRLLLEAHERVLHVFALIHHGDEVEVGSYGHFDGNTGRYVACGSGMVKTVVHEFGMAAGSVGDSGEDREGRLLGEAVATQAALTGLHSPNVEHGVTTPITPAEPTEPLVVKLRERKPGEIDDSEAVYEALAAIKGVKGAQIVSDRELHAEGEVDVIPAGVIFTEGQAIGNETAETIPTDSEGSEA